MVPVEISTREIISPPLFRMFDKGMLIAVLKVQFKYFLLVCSWSAI